MDDTARLNELLDRLRDGDVAAGEALFRAYEPYLRMVVRRRLTPSLRAKFDSVDIVQSIWADVFHHFGEAEWDFADATALRSFLATVARNKFIDRSRHHQRADSHAQAYAESVLATSPQINDRPSQHAQAHDLWERMLAMSDPSHHELLRLKRDGHSLDEIAERTGLHKSSVRRILYDLALKLAVA